MNSTKPKEKKSSEKMFLRRSHILWILIICEAVSGDRVTKAVSSEATFAPGTLAPGTTSIMWKHRNNDGFVVKVIEWDRDDNSIEIPNSKFRYHASLNKGTGELTLRNVQLEHAGVYSVDINSKEQRKQFSLTVMNSVSKPYITKECAPDVLVCSLSCEGDNGSSETTISWKNSDGLIPYGQNENMRMLTVSMSSNPENFYTCTLKNAVSEETSDPMYETDLFHDSNTNLVIGIVVPLIAVVLIILIIKLLCCVLRRHW